jgi:predicted amidohydrolase
VQRTVDDMARLSLTSSDPIFDRIGEFAQRNKVYMAFQNFETHPKMPGRVFNSAFLVDDSGNLVHTYRKNQCADVWGLLPRLKAAGASGILVLPIEKIVP